VNFIIKHDKKERFLFASLQSDAANEILLQFTSKKIGLESIILIQNEKIYDKSTAALMIMSHLNKGYRFLGIFKIIPEFLRDAIYQFIAKNRYKWFGKNEHCLVPSESIRSRFLG